MMNSTGGETHIKVIESKSAEVWCQASKQIECLVQELSELISLERKYTTNLVQQLSELMDQGVQATLLIQLCAIVLCSDNSV